MIRSGYYVARSPHTGELEIIQIIDDYVIVMGSEIEEPFEIWEKALVKGPFSIEDLL